MPGPGRTGRFNLRPRGYNERVPLEPNNMRPRVACDAMCGGVARWLRVFGVDSSYTPGIEDGDLVAQARDEGRVVISADGLIFERRVFATGELRGVRLPVGLRLLDQVEFVVRALGIEPGFPRCSECNGRLEPVDRADVADVVPARTLIWVRDFFRCRTCRHVYWEGTHWRRIGSVRARLRRG